MQVLKDCAMKTYWGMEVKFHVFLTSLLDRGEWWTSCFIHYTLGKEPLYTPDGRLGWLQSMSGCSGKKNISAPARNWTLAVQHVVSQYWLSYPISAIIPAFSINTMAANYKSLCCLTSLIQTNNGHTCVLRRHYFTSLTQPAEEICF
jgi:hypothetical protein